MVLVCNKSANSKIYDDVLKILDKLTGVKWGFVKSKHRVKYLSSVEVPIKIGIEWGKFYEKNIKYKLDISIQNKSPRAFESYVAWEDAIGVELQSGLLLFTSGTIADTVSQWEPTEEYADLLREAHEQNSAFQRQYAHSRMIIFDAWADGCVRE